MLNENEPETASVQEVIEREIRSLLLDEDGDEISISAADTLLGVGLNSLLLAQLLIQLEAEFDADPFASDVSIADMRTVGDLVAAYQQAFEPAGRQ